MMWIWKRSQSTNPLLLSGVVLVVLSLSFGCGGTTTSSDLADSSFVDAATESSATLGVVASASSFVSPPGERRGDGPPEEALAACADISVGASCSFTGPGGESRDGTCTVRPDDSEQVVCRPDGFPRRRGDREGPPEESLAACSGADAGAACSFEAPFGSVSGTCAMPREGDALACRPTNRDR